MQKFRCSLSERPQGFSGARSQAATVATDLRAALARGEREAEERLTAQAAAAERFEEQVGEMEARAREAAEEVRPRSAALRVAEAQA